MKARDVIELAEKWLKENYPIGSLIRTYNSINPLPRGYRMKLGDNWCAAFVSSLFWTVSAGDEDAFPYECGCERMVELAMEKKLWVEDESVMPRIGWIPMFDWQDNGKGDNRGWSDHTGIITQVNEKTFNTIEGNVSGRIARRNIKFNDKKLRGFIAPKYSDTSVTKTVQDVALEVIRGLWGTGKTRKERLSAAGYDYKVIQTEVNRLMKEL